MKKLLLAATFVFICISSAHAQFEFGLKTGVNFASITGDDVEDDSKSNLGLNFGVVGRIYVSDLISIQPEVVYSVQGYKEEFEDIKFQDVYSYVNVPLMVDFTVLDGLSAQVGPQLGALIARNFFEDGELIDDEGDDLTEGIKTLDIGLGIGAQYRLEDLGLFGQLRYTPSLSSFAEEEEGESFDVKHSVVSISVGWFF